MPTDTSEKGLESLIVASLVDEAGYVQGDSQDYDPEHAVDLPKLLQFLASTQPDAYEKLGIDQDGPKRDQFLHRLQGEITKRGVVDVLRNGLKHGPISVNLFYGTPTPGNAEAAKLFKANIFGITRQLHYSQTKTALSLDMAVFINGLPIATFELKNNLTKQTVHDAVHQYNRDRDPKELLFQFKRCVAHFAVDDKEVRFCTRLQGKNSWFLPFNKGHKDGAGNPPNPQGIATDYLWKEVLSKQGLTDILENYAQVVEEKDEKTKKKKYKQIFPRYHQLAVVRLLLADARNNDVGKRYLIQHSAGSGKSNSIAWLAHQLVGLERDGEVLFDSIIVVTDRRVLDKQIRDTIKQFAQVAATVGHAEHSGDLRKFLKDGKKIIVSTVQKFPLILTEIGNELQDKKFAIIIDEAHSSQGGKTTSAMNVVLGKSNKEATDEDKIDTGDAVTYGHGETSAELNIHQDDGVSQDGEDNEEETTEDKINKAMESRKMLTNASYFAFTATPKNKTLEIFGEASSQPGGMVKYSPFHGYTMKQAIQEVFILDVLQHYTPVQSYYRLVQTVEDDPVFDSKKAHKKLRRYVESHQHAIREKTEIMVDHFHTHVIGHHKIGGRARAMVITKGVKQAIQYFHAFSDYLRERKSPYRPIVAFSGEREHDGKRFTEAKLNGFPSNKITEQVRQDPYRFLIVADKYQTGYDEPLLHTMYVDKPLSGIRAVQTLSRLNRAHPKKHDTFVLDFYNDSDMIQKSFEPYYRTTILSDKTDPNKLHNLQSTLDSHQVYSEQQISNLVELYLNGAARDQLDPILDTCVNTYKTDLKEDDQVDFKGKAKTFVRIYGFLAAVLPYSYAEWEKLYTFLNFLIPKLPAPKEDDLSRGILETIDMDSYRAEIQASQKIGLPDQDGEIDPVPIGGGGGGEETEMDILSSIIKAFNDQFGNISWQDADKIRKVITEEIPAKVAADPAYQNAIKNNDKKTAQIEHDAALQKVMNALLSDHTELFKQFSDNPSFKKWLGNAIFELTYQQQIKQSAMKSDNIL
ncbi:MAG: type I restriction endonuclease subunit R [Pseudohongiellaceae bacterium]